MGLPNFKWRTVNGGIWWDTVKAVRGSCIQRHVITGHCRLLDSENYRVAWGSRRECENALKDALAGAIVVLPNVKTLVLDAGIFWDTVWADGCWRIQRNVLTGHCRLIDGRGRRHAWGSLKDCKQIYRKYCAFEVRAAIARTKAVPHVLGNEAVFLVHGFLSSGRAMTTLGSYLLHKGYSVYAQDYPTTCKDVAQCVRHLDEDIRAVEASGYDSIHLVGHSMGGLMILQLLHQRRPRKLGRIVLLGTPCSGSNVASYLRSLAAPLEGFFGPIADLMAREEGMRIPRRKGLEVGVIAGGSRSSAGLGRLIPGDNDGVVEVASTRLKGMRDFIVLRARHSQLHHNRRSMEAVADFLLTGAFRGPEDRQ